MSTVPDKMPARPTTSGDTTPAERAVDLFAKGVAAQAGEGKLRIRLALYETEDGTSAQQCATLEGDPAKIGDLYAIAVSAVTATFEEGVKQLSPRSRLRALQAFERRLAAADSCYVDKDRSFTHVADLAAGPVN